MATIQEKYKYAGINTKSGKSMIDLIRVFKLVVVCIILGLIVGLSLPYLAEALYRMVYKPLPVCTENLNNNEECRVREKQ